MMSLMTPSWWCGAGWTRSLPVGRRSRGSMASHDECWLTGEEPRNVENDCSGPSPPSRKRRWNGIRRMNQRKLDGYARLLAV